MSKHTPGPWEVKRPTYAHCTVITSKTRTICTMTSRDADDPQTGIDARLTASAPDLLEALQNLERIVIDAAIFPTPDMILDAGKALKAARAAILKATEER